MVGTKIDGIFLAKTVRERIKKAVIELKKQEITPCLATILVGDDPASATYVKNKHNACSEVGITTRDCKLDSDTTQSNLDGILEDLNSDKSVHGILVQLPLPKHLDEFATISKISPLKDVDGLTPHNAGLLAANKAMLVACTPSGIMEIFSHYNIDVEGKNIILINRSNLVGKPLYHLLLAKNATVTTCHSKTRNLNELCQQADIIITAVGNRNKFTLTSDMIKDGAVIIDIAISRFNGVLTGDSDFKDIIQKASFATPVPGGVGPMTVAMLLKNTITATTLSTQIGRQSR